MSRCSNLLAFGASLIVGVAALLVTATPAAAQNLIKNPTQHPHYAVELEPHLVLDFIGEDHIGIGGRATIPIVDPGFVSTINNSVGIGFGAAFLDGNHHTVLTLPAVMQWNFWFTPNWSAFGEPGLTLNVVERNNDTDLDLDPVMAVGGRYNFNDHISLTGRVGYPYASFGVSFFL